MDWFQIGKGEHQGYILSPGFFNFYAEWIVKVAQSWLTLCNPMDCPWNSLGQNTGVGSLSLLQGIFPTQESDPGLPHCRQILYQLSHKGSPRILEWVAYLFSSGSSRPKDRTRVSCIAGRFFTNWAISEARILYDNIMSIHDIKHFSNPIQLYHIKNKLQ